MIVWYYGQTGEGDVDGIAWAVGGQWQELISVVLLLLQVAEAILALNLIRVTGWRVAWVSIAGRSCCWRWNAPASP